MAAGFQIKTKLFSDFDTQMGGEGGGRKLVSLEVSLGDSYTTGGEDVALLDIEAKAKEAGATLLGVQVNPSADGATLYTWDRVNGKILAFSAVGTEVVATTDLDTDPADHFQILALVNDGTA